MELNGLSLTVMPQPVVTFTFIIYDQNWVTFPSLVFTARRYASAVLAVIVCLSVCHKSELYKDG